MGARGVVFVLMNPIVGIGELLWDVYPDGRKAAGGAPFNFAFHCHQLGHPAAIVSRVGDDDLGRELRAEVRRLGMPDEFIQVDRHRPTGTVQVSLDANGVPAYTITEDVAWDRIEWGAELRQLAGNATAVCFGTLAQRSETSRATVQRILSDARSEPGERATRILDINLRLSYFNREQVIWSLLRSDIVKLNGEELRVLARLFGWRGTGPHELAKELFDFSAAETRLVVVTRGGEGCDLYPRQGDPLHEPTPAARVADTVGAGDAFTAAMACLHLEGKPLQACARFAAHYAARVCEHQGATPRIDRAGVERAAFGSSRSTP